MTDPPVLDLGFARLDLGREQRQGIAEVVYGPGKTREQIDGIAAGLLEHNTGPVLVTRVEPGNRRSRARAGGRRRLRRGGPAALLATRCRAGDFTVAVVSAGTADGPVAAEARAVAAAIGLGATVIHDVGVAGLHRVLRRYRTGCRPATRSSSSPGWRARWPASSAASSPAR